MKKYLPLILLFVSLSSQAMTIMEFFGKKKEPEKVPEVVYVSSKGYQVLLNEKLSESLTRWGNAEGVEITWNHPADVLFKDDKQVDQFNLAIEKLSARPEQSGQTDLVAATNAASATMDWSLSLGKDPNLRGFPRAKICVWQTSKNTVTMIRVTTVADFTCGVE